MRHILHGSIEQEVLWFASNLKALSDAIEARWCKHDKDDYEAFSMHTAQALVELANHQLRAWPNYRVEIVYKPDKE